eukprot:TRINITY_DN34_c0_g1_i1.p1 TRINITY_DN34_c0_g1~~TRINITY_DN34_c0_g1_i1.p1  ORF type:complete len:385 (+),score=110.21 TRINITY_DN34_c0_g1_i1:78-1232(+)
MEPLEKYTTIDKEADWAEYVSDEENEDYSSAKNAWGNVDTVDAVNIREQQAKDEQDTQLERRNQPYRNRRRDNDPSVYRPPRPEREERPRGEIPEHGPWKAFVGNLNYDMEESEIHEYFEELGVVETNLLFDRETGRSKGFALIEFEDKVGLENALLANGTEFKGRKLNVDVAHDRSRGSRGRSNYGGRSDRFDRNDRYERRDNGYNSRFGRDDGRSSWSNNNGPARRNARPQQNSSQQPSRARPDRDTNREDPFAGAAPHSADRQREKEMKRLEREKNIRNQRGNNQNNRRDNNNRYRNNNRYEDDNNSGSWRSKGKGDWRDRQDDQSNKNSDGFISQYNTRKKNKNRRSYNEPRDNVRNDEPVVSDEKETAASNYYDILNNA